MVKISDNVNQDENEPEVLFDAMHHAREPLSMETTLLFMDWLIDNYKKDPEATYLVDNREMFFDPASMARAAVCTRERAASICVAMSASIH